MKYLFALLAFAGACFGQTYEDWNCYTFTAASSVAGGKTNLTCNAPHGWANGQNVIMWGATGSWLGLNTKLDQTVSNIEAISATDTSMQVNDTSKVIVPSIMLIDSEQVGIQSKDSNYLTFGNISGCSGGTNGRGCNGTTAASHVATNAGGITTNNNFQDHWSATVIDASTIQVAFDSSSAGSFSGQTVKVSRSSPGDLPSPLVRPYYGQPWAVYYDIGSDGLEINIPACATLADPYLCSRGFLAGANGKGYSFSNTNIATAVVSGTFPNQIVTVTFSTNFVDQANNGVLRDTSACTAFGMGVGCLVYLGDFDETSTCMGCLNHAYLVQSVTSSGGNKVGAVLIAGGRHNVTNGTYSTGTSAIACNKSATPCLIMPWLGDGYTDSNPGSSYPTGAVSSQIKNGGTWSAANNRMRWLITWKNLSRAGVVPSMELGTYDFFGTDPTDLAHMYQDTSPNFVDGKQMALDYTETWDHVVGASAEFYPNDANVTVPGWLQNPSWRGGQRHFFDALQRFYMDESSSNPLTPSIDGSTMAIRSISFSRSNFSEPEELVKDRSILYDGTKYQLSWNTPQQGFATPNFATTYNLAYSTASGCATGAYSSGTSDGSATAASGANNYVQHNTPNMALAATFCEYVRPIVSVYSISANGQSPIWLWTPVNTGMLAGDHITTSGIGGNGNVTNTAINTSQWAQMWSVKAPNSTQPWTGAGNMTSIASDGSGNCTVTLNGVNHNLAVGWPFYVFYPPSSPTFGADQALFTVSSVVNATTFKFLCPVTATANSTWNTDQDSTHHFGIEAWPGISLAGTGSGLSLSSGTIVSTEDTKNFAVIPLASSVLSSGGSALGGNITMGGNLGR